MNEEITYPCTWHYRIIGANQEELYNAAFDNVPKQFIYTQGNTSSGGKYQSLNIELQVENQQERDAIFQALQKDSRIKFVL